MRNILMLVFGLSLLMSCQTENKKASEESSVTEQEAKPISVVDVEELVCFENKDGFSISLNNKGDQYKGVFETVEGGTNVKGAIHGALRDGDIIADMEYVLSNKKHQEKVIINITGQTLSIARSGSVNINGERLSRNNGEATMDLLSRADCE